MSVAKRRLLAVTAVGLAGACAQWAPATAGAEPTQETPTEVASAPTADVLHNITYRARVDGVSRGATVTYRAEGDQLQLATPTMVPGRVFEVNTVLPASQTANLRLSIDWPYSANLHCEILIDNAVVAKADDFIAPRVTPQREDPDYGSLTCQAPVGGIDDITPTEAPAPPPPVEAGIPPA
ncbi:Uncharacterised protein [Mycolicibacterium vanbaalenii]|uniref:Uncharacterized protein n=1 Tax=Mycolicibacterium vanbaalenii TaxID=110539 RepID=A0A5S9QY59_MYCVN|nr:hypothetical protein [Mycolicibacterium vanbaalenii]CAA0123840.1 Uncharacterised protein [Mycolicibacterium vanbaalenii]